MASDKKKKPTSKVVATAVSVAAGVVFSAGAVSLAQGSTQFDPGNFVSAYAHGDDGSDKGYRASRSDVDAQANRHSNESEDDSRSTSNQMLEDAFSQMPLAGDSGTTAYRVSSDAPQDNRVSAGTAGGGNTANGGDGNVVVGPVVPGNGNAGDANNGNGNGNGTGDDPSEPSTPDNPGTPDTPDNPSQPETPWVNPLPNDPTPSKDQIGEGSFLPEIPVDGMAPSYNLQGDTPNLLVWKELSYGFDGTLYVGQKLDAWTVFCSLYTGYVDPDFSAVHLWTCQRSEFLYSDPENPKAGGYAYFRIVDYPDVVPSGSFTIKYQYRFNAHDKWADGEFVYEDPAPSRAYIMNAAKKPNGSSSVFKILSGGEGELVDGVVFLPQYSANLMAEAGCLPKDEYGQASVPDEGAPISKLLLGWKLDGKPTEYYCEVGDGRHVIEPGELVDIPKGFSVVMRSFFVEEDLRVVPKGQLGGKLGYFQVLASADESAVRGGKLTVPNGVEAVCAAGNGIKTGTLALPASVFYVDASASGLRVDDAYWVAEGNAVYSSTDDGLLTNKAGTTYEAIPVGKKTLTVPESITKVNLSPDNALETIKFNAKTTEALPQVNLGNLDSCRLVIDDGVFRSFVLTNYDELVDANLSVAKASNEFVGYTIKSGMLCQGSDLVSVIDEKVSASSKTLVVDGVRRFKSGAFQGSQNAENIILGDGDYEFEDGCFEGGNVTRIICKTEEQLEYVKSRLDATGANEDAKAILSERNDQGFSWTTEVDADGNEVVTLLEAPYDIEYYDGCLTRNDSPDECIVPDVISARVFANHENLKWVTLREGTSQIGDAAFEGCSNLESLFIEGFGAISVGKDALVGCASLRFVASNAMEANFESNENPSGCAMYCLDGSEGYNVNFHREPRGYFVDDDGNWAPSIESYTVAEQENGSRVLCGVNARWEGPYIAIASDSSLPSVVDLPKTTQEIFSGAFADIDTPFTLNWSELTYLWGIYGSGSRYDSSNKAYYALKGAFQDSALRGDVTISPRYFDPSVIKHILIGGQAFEGCSSIESFESDPDYCIELEAAFGGCSSLKSFSMGLGDDDSCQSEISWGVFSGCDSLDSITLSGSVSPQLRVYSGEAHLPFSFKGESLKDDVSSGFKINVSSDETKHSLIENWTYPFAGYISDSPYEDMYASVKSSLTKKLQRVPTHLEVIDEMSSQLLAAENSLRDMLGMEHATAPMVLSSETTESGCKFIDTGSEVQLVEAPADLEVADFGSLIPEKYKGRDIVICSAAFSACADLREVRISSDVKSIESGAFAGCDKLEKIIFPDGENRLKYSDSVYSFTGKSLEEESKTLKLEGLGDNSGSLIKDWVYWFNGAESSGSMRQIVNKELKTTLGRAPYPSELYEVILDRSLKTENFLRDMMGLSHVETPSNSDIEIENGCWFLSSPWATYLIKAPDNLETINLDELIPDSMADSGVTIEKGAFSMCGNAKKIILSDKVSSMSSGAFIGCDNVEVDLPVVSESGLPAIKLDLEYDDSGNTLPFSFGSDSVKIVAPDENSQKAYLKWLPRYANWHSSEDDLLEDALMRIIYGSASLSNLNSKVNENFLDIENEIRIHMGLPTVEKLEDMYSYYDAVAALEEAGYITEADDSSEEGGNDGDKDNSGGLSAALSNSVEPQAVKVAAEPAVSEGAESAKTAVTKPTGSGVGADANKTEAAPTDSASDDAASGVKSER